MIRAGSPETAHEFAELGFTSLEFGLVPESLGSLEAIGRVVELLDT